MSRITKTTDDTVQADLVIAKEVICGGPPVSQISARKVANGLTIANSSGAFFTNGNVYPAYYTTIGFVTTIACTIISDPAQSNVNQVVDLNFNVGQVGNNVSAVVVSGNAHTTVQTSFQPTGLNTVRVAFLQDNTPATPVQFQILITVPTA